ncbi:MAG: hypothetical protein LBQ46_02350 [Treponema sp.]|jgi:hypothetical protein|nr:hypothetical protein [Treponema sp.]
MKGKLGFLGAMVLLFGITGCPDAPPDTEDAASKGDALKGDASEFVYSSAAEDAVIVFKESGVHAALAGGFGYQIFRDGGLISSGTISLEGPALTFNCGGYGPFPAKNRRGYHHLYRYYKKR